MGKVECDWIESGYKWFIIHCIRTMFLPVHVKMTLSPGDAVASTSPVTTFVLSARLDESVTS